MKYVKQLIHYPSCVIRMDAPDLRTVPCLRNEMLFSNEILNAVDRCRQTNSFTTSRRNGDCYNYCSKI